MKYGLATIVIGVALLGFMTSPTQAAVVVYSATDVGAGPGDPTPNADGAAAAFAAGASALGGVSTVTFESAPIGSFSNLTVAPGVSIDGPNYNGNTLFIANTSNFPSAPALDGFNTTPGGANFVEMIGGSLVFTFAKPIQFFGANFLGVQPGFFAATITFNDSNGPQSVSISNPTPYNGGVSFVGFTDAGQLISSVTVSYGGPGYGDFSGLDDVRFQTIPEPSTLTLAGFAIVCGAARIVKRRRTA